MHPIEVAQTLQTEAKVLTKFRSFFEGHQNDVTKENRSEAADEKALRLEELLGTLMHLLKMKIHAYH